MTGPAPRVADQVARISGSRLGIPEGSSLLEHRAGVDDFAERPPELMELAYAVHMLVGMLVVALGAHHFAERTGSAGPARRATNNGVFPA
ncbi:hypothetical protein [Streptomyces sp. NPDC058249]|uniref:hypothetical protein n=1 Tax=Streptomyces sp. NPDC058249 TaxID=3346403 RepID=UPI0036E13A20